MEKTCFRCGTIKPLSEFYRHSAMTDGHLGKCKHCTRSDVQRKADIKQCRIRQKLLNPHKFKARQKLLNSIRKGIVQRKPCEICGSSKSEGHHEDYQKPLEVKWLCRKHHALRHRELKGQGIVLI